MKKYGYKNFKTCLLSISESRSKIESIEEMLVNEFYVKRTNNYNYNVAIGGITSHAGKGLSPISQEEAISKFKNIHGPRYLYENVKYINSFTHINVTCRNHGDFGISPNNHTMGKNCPKCANLTRSRKAIKTRNIKIYEVTDLDGGFICSGSSYKCADFIKLHREP